MISFVFVHILLIAQRLLELLADYRGGCHARYRGLVAVVVGGLGIFSQRELYRNGRLHDKLVHALRPERLYQRERTAYRICASDARTHAGNSRADRVPKTPVHGVYAVDGAQMRGRRVGDLVAVVALELH